MVGPGSTDEGPFGSGRGGVAAADGGGRLLTPTARRGRLSVAADARLVHRDGLIEALAAVDRRPDGPSPNDADLILFSYLAWGPRCTTKLEGDFAFVLWDADLGVGLASTDFAAGRTLFHATVGTTTLVASSVEALAGIEGVDDSLDVVHLGEVTAGLWAGSDRTCRSGVRRIMPGHSLIAPPNASPRLTRHWSLPCEHALSRLPFDKAAVELRDRIVDGVGEHLRGTSRAAIWLSGGWDSTAVFAAGHEWLRRNGGDPAALVPISMSYPRGDPGYEDDLIRAVTDHWSVKPNWIDVDTVPVIDDAPGRALLRDEPWYHPFQLWNEALADASARAGAQLVMTGNGGDQLFSSPIAPLSDLFWTGRWAALSREWGERGGRGLRQFLRVCVLPGLPREFYESIGRVRGTRPRHYLDRQTAPWVRRDFVASNGLLERQWDERRWPGPGGASRAEMEFFFDTAYMARITGTINRISWDRGLENASPLLDPRVVALAASRPADERSQGLVSKRLLRKAMAGLLPDTVLAPRREKTGLTVGYFERGLRAALAGGAADLGSDLVLESLGIIDASDFRSHARAYQNGRAPESALGIYLTIHVELWLRTHLGMGTRGDDRGMEYAE